MSDFDSTPLVVGDSPTTLGEMRDMANRTRNRPQEEWIGALAKDPILIITAAAGMANAIYHLLDLIEHMMKEGAESG